MKQRLFVCDTPYQILNALNIQWHENEIESDIYIINQFSSARCLYENVCASGLFLNVFLLQQDERLNIKCSVKRTMINVLDAANKTRRLCKQFNVRRKSDLPEYKYKSIYASVASVLVVSILRLNPQAEFVLFDDGIGSYYGDITKCMGLWKHNILSILFFHGSYTRKPTKLLVNNVNMCKSTATENICQLPKFDEQFIKYACDIFGMGKSLLLEKKIIFLSQAADGDEKVDMLQREIVEMLKPYKKDVMVRIHPRDNNVEMYNEFEIDTSKDLWELKIQSFDIEQCVLISVNSSAQYTPKMCFCKEPTVFLMFTLLRDKQTLQTSLEFANKLKDSYVNGERVIIPKSKQEVIDKLNKFLSVV